MSGKHGAGALEGQSAVLVVRRVIHTDPARLFEYWTRPDHLKKWWGPASVKCVDAQIDLRPGGRYRIGNQFPDGSIVWIAGEFEVIEPPHMLVYTWRIEPESRTSERVTVQFEPRDRNTEIIITHERIADALARDRHETGWQGCLDGLERYLVRPDC